MRIQRMFPIAIALLLLIAPVASGQMGKSPTPTYDAENNSFSILPNVSLQLWQLGTVHR
jgi:hypothetical protein